MQYDRIYMSRKSRFKQVLKPRLKTNKQLEVSKMEKQSWKIEDGKWAYYMDNGSKAKGLQRIGDRTFYLNANGHLEHEKWVNLDGNMFYILSDGSCAKGWKWILGETYYFYEKPTGKFPECSMAKDTIVSGVYLGTDGKAGRKK